MYLLSITENVAFELKSTYNSQGSLNVAFAVERTAAPHPVVRTLKNTPTVLSAATRLSGPCARRPRCEESVRPSCDRKLTDVKEPEQTEPSV